MYGHLCPHFKMHVDIPFYYRFALAIVKSCRVMDEIIIYSIKMIVIEIPIKLKSPWKYRLWHRSPTPNTIPVDEFGGCGYS